MEEKKVALDDKINLLRGICYAFSKLAYLQDEPICKQCSLFVKVLESIQNKFIEIEKSINKDKEIQQDIKVLLYEIYYFLSNVKFPENPTEQFILGKCSLPREICFAYTSLKDYERLKEILGNKEENFFNG